MTLCLKCTTLLLFLTTYIFLKNQFLISSKAYFLLEKKSYSKHIRCLQHTYIPGNRSQGTNTKTSPIQ